MSCSPAGFAAADSFGRTASTVVRAHGEFLWLLAVS